MRRGGLDSAASQRNTCADEELAATD